MDIFNETNEVQQGSDQWKVDRLKGIGGSEIAVVLGVSPYKTRYQLWLEKTGLVTEVKAAKDISNDMQVTRGHSAEEVARALINKDYKRSFKPKVWDAGGILRCSDDGYCSEINQILEIKAMGKENHENVANGIIPDHYMLQCIWNLGVSKAESCMFVSVRPEDDYDLNITIVKPDLDRFLNMVKAAEDFMDLVKTQTPPELSDKDCIVMDSDEFFAEEEAYVTLLKERDRLDQLIEISKANLETRLGANGSVEGNRVKITRVNRKGNVNYKSIPQLLGVDLEPFRGGSSVFTKITVKKERK